MDGLLILAIETASGCGSVALTKGGRTQGRLVAEYSLYPERSHSRHLLGMVQTMLKESAVPWEAIDAVAVSQGPGSFTGLRIGMAAAKGLAFAAEKKLVAVPTLATLAAQLPPLRKPVWALLDARKSQVYAACYDTSSQDDAGLPERLGPYLVCASACLLSRFTAPVICIGPGLAACGEAFHGHPMVRSAPAAVVLPRAAMVGFCAADMLRCGSASQLSDHNPLYVRASEAELNRAAQMKKEVQA